MVENIVRKAEIACSKQFLLFSQCFQQSYICSASKCGIVRKWVKTNLPNSNNLSTSKSQLSNLLIHCIGLL